MSVLLEIRVFVWQHVCTFMEKSQVFSENLGSLSENPGFLSELSFLEKIGFL